MIGLGLLAGPARVYLGIALIGLAATGAAWLHHSGAVSGRAEVQGRWDSETATRAKAAIRAMDQNAAIGEARIKTQREVVYGTKKRNQRAAVAAAGAVVAGNGLRERFAAVAATCRGPATDTGAGSSAPPANTAADLLTDVQRRIDEAAGVVAAFADAAHTAGLGCQREHDSLMEGQSP